MKVLLTSSHSSFKKQPANFWVCWRRVQVERRGDRTIPVDVPVIVATHRNLHDPEKKGVFRELEAS